MNIKSLSLAGGLLHGLVVLILTLLSMVMGMESQTLALLTEFVPMYSVSIVGAIIGFAYAFVIGYLVMYLFGTFYHFFEE